jgi:hypothetical protein
MSTERTDDLGPREPGLEHLFLALTSRPTPDELAGERAALAMFRASRRPAVHHRLVTRRLATAAAAVTLAVAAGLAIAAYTAVLPASVQHAAYRALGFMGVPDRAAAPSAAHRAVGVRPVSRERKGSQRLATPPQQSAHPGSSRASATSAGRLSLVAQDGQIPAGGRDVFSGVLTGSGGQPLAGVSISLYQRNAGQATSRLAGQATTSPDGGVVISVRDITRNAWFRLVGSDDVVSQRALVTVVPAVTVQLIADPGQRTYLVTVSSPLAEPGNAVVLQVQNRGGWQNVSMGQLNRGDQATFTVPATDAAYRVVLPRTITHALSVSSPVSASSARSGSASRP